MFDVVMETLETGRVVKYCLRQNGSAVTYSAAIDLWRNDGDFRSYVTTLLVDSEFEGFRWETPSVSTLTAGRPFEFVLVDTPGFARRGTDRATYAEHFSESNDIVSFANLSGDATLVVPCPRTGDGAYGHLAAFVRCGPRSQVDALWQALGQTVASRLSAVPVWVSTAGGGVAWLHVRLDNRPKYYAYPEYRAE